MQMKKIISILLCVALLGSLLAGCSVNNDPVAYEPTGNGLEDYQEAVLDAEEEESTQSFSLAYYEEASMNPLIADDFTNRVIISLLYQGLFAVTRENEVQPILCKNYTASADLLTYEFTIDPLATYSDGVPVTAEDVVASLNTAKNNKYYGGRLRYVSDIAVTETGAVRIRLTQAYGNLPLLLDIPIVKASQVEYDNPLGTGPYQLSGWGRERSLVRRESWWCRSENLQVTAKKIPLVSADSATTIRDAFEFYDVGVVCTDPGSDKYVEYRCDYELWECETGIFLYLGVNANSSAFQNQAVRQALTKGIDRDYLIDKYYRGFAVGAELPASPNSPYYTEPLAQHYAYDQAEFQNAMSSMKGRPMYVIPYSMGVVGSPFAKYGIELTDSIYVVLSMAIMTRMGKEVYEALGDSADYIKGLHSKAELDPEKRYIVHFPEENSIMSVNSGYGGRRPRSFSDGEE